MPSRTRIVAALGVLALLAGVACNVAQQSERLHRWHAHGVVEAVDVKAGQVVVSHEDIPGLMPAMTMNFNAAPDLVAKLSPGQEIDFTLELRGQDFSLVQAKVVGGQARAGSSGGIPSVSDNEQAPPFTLIDQDGRTVSLSDLRGQVVLLDFIYTHCPGPCPILTGIHVQLQRELPASLKKRVHLVSISLDPVRDTPAVLRAYAKARGVDFDGWSFLTGDKTKVGEVLKHYFVGTTPGADGQIDHIVITYLIDPKGRVVKRFLGTEHRAGELLKAVERVAG